MLTIRRKQRAAFGNDPAKSVAVPPPPPKVPDAQPTAESLTTPPTGRSGLLGVQIRPEQMKDFELASRKPFEDEMVAHSREFSPRLCEVLGEEQLRMALRQAMDRAGGYGFTYRGPLRLWIEMMFLFGSAFDTDPQYPWAAKNLRSTDDQMQRAEYLFDAIVDYQKNVSGPDGANTRRALKALSALAPKPIAFTAADFTVGMCREMNLAYPEKAAYIGNEALRALAREGSAKAQKYRFSTIRSEALMVTLMFAFGHGCPDDPLYPWIGRTLKDEKIVDAAARSERLEKKAVTWLEHVIAPLGEGVQT